MSNLQSSTLNPPSQIHPHKLTLNVGGVSYISSYPTLQRSQYLKYVIEQQDKEYNTHKGYFDCDYFIDRNGNLFTYILEVLRGIHKDTVVHSIQCPNLQNIFYEELSIYQISPVVPLSTNVMKGVITLDELTDPVMLSTDGKFYSEHAIRKWLLENQTCPTTRQQIHPDDIDNVIFKLSAIRELISSKVYES